MRIVIDGTGLVPLATNDPTGYYADLTEYVSGIAGPDASKFWGEHLSTIPVTGELIVSRDDCPLAWSSSSSSSGGGSGGAEKDGNNNQTFVDADLVIYLLMDNGPCTNEDPPIAMSDVCLSDQYDRPIAGKVLLCTSGNFDSLTSDTVVGAAQRRRIDEVLRHEFAHVLGMSGSTAPYWRDANDGGNPRTLRPLVPSDDVICPNGKTEMGVYIPSTETYAMGTTSRGTRYYDSRRDTVETGWRRGG